MRQSFGKIDELAVGMRDQTGNPASAIGNIRNRVSCVCLHQVGPDGSLFLKWMQAVEDRGRLENWELGGGSADCECLRACFCLPLLVGSCFQALGMLAGWRGWGP